MAVPHEIISLNSQLLAGIGATGYVTSDSDESVTDAQYQERAGASSQYTTSFQPETGLIAEFLCPTYTVQAAVVALLDWPANTEERDLTISVGDPASLVAGTGRVVVSSVTMFPGRVTAQFKLTSAVWRETTTSVTVPAATTFTALPGAFTPVNAGHARAYPTYKLGWTTQRTTDSNDAGWKLRRTITIENDSTEAIVNRTYILDVGDTAALVAAGKSPAGGGNMLIFCEGTSIPRELVNWNTGRSSIAFNINVPALSSRVYEWWYDNDDSGIAASLIASLNYQNTMENNVYGSVLDLLSYNGTATSGAASTITDTGKAFPVNRLRGGNIQIISGTGAGQRRRITSNTATVVTVARAWTTNPSSSSVYVIWLSGVFVTGGAASAGSTTTLTDAAQVWSTNQLKGMSLWNVTDATGPFTIASNTGTVITIEGTMTAPTVPDVYYVEGAGYHTYYVDRSTTHNDEYRGMFRVWPRDKAPSRIFYGDELAEGWNLATFLRNNDDYAQRDYFYSTIPYGILFAQRRASSDATLIGKANGDGLMISHPLGYTGMYFDWELQNEDRGDGTGVGKSIVAAQRGGGGDWYRAVEDSTVRDVITAVSPQFIDWTTAIGGSAKTIYMGGVPNDDEQIPSTAKVLADVQERAYQRMELYVDMADLTVTLGAETTIYDYGIQLDVGGGNGTVRPFDRILAGHQAGQGHYVALEASQELWVRTDPQAIDDPLVAIYTTAGVLVRETPWAAQCFRMVDDIDGAELPLIWHEYAPLPPGTNLITNPTALTNTTGWAEEDTIGTITPGWNREAAVFYDAAGSFEANVTANTTAGVGIFASRFLSPRSDITAGKLYEVTAAVRTNGTSNLEPRIGIRWYDASDVFIPGSESGLTDWTPVISVWFPRGEYGVAPATAVYARISLALYSNASGATGQARWDAIVFGPPAVWIDEEEMGVVYAKVEWEEGYLG